jgi:hypothetical protein
MSVQYGSTLASPFAFAWPSWLTFRSASAPGAAAPAGTGTLNQCQRQLCDAVRPDTAISGNGVRVIKAAHDSNSPGLLECTKEWKASGAPINCLADYEYEDVPVPEASAKYRRMEDALVRRYWTETRAPMAEVTKRVHALPLDNAAQDDTIWRRGPGGTATLDEAALYRWATREAAV